MSDNARLFIKQLPVTGCRLPGYPQGFTGNLIFYFYLYRIRGKKNNLVQTLVEKKLH